MQRAPLYVAAMDPATEWMRSAIRGAAWTLSRHRTPQKVGFLLTYTCELLSQHERRRDNEKVNLENTFEQSMPSRPGYHTFASPQRVRKPRRRESRAHAHGNVLYQTATTEFSFPFRFRRFVSDMRGKCIRKAAAAEFSLRRGRKTAPRTGKIIPKRTDRLTRTSCPVLLNPVPFFIKIKKKFIRTHGGRLEL